MINILPMSKNKREGNQFFLSKREQSMTLAKTDTYNKAERSHTKGA